MDVTLEWILFGVGIAGAVICLILFLASWKIFAKQRKKTIEFLEKL